MAASSAALTWTSASFSSFSSFSSSSSLLLQQHSQSSLLHHRPILPLGPTSSLLSPSATASSSPPSFVLPRTQSLFPHPFAGCKNQNFQSRTALSCFRPPQQQLQRWSVVRGASSSPRGAPATESEEVFFDGGVHYGDLVTNLLFGLTLVWLPLTVAAVFRGLFLRYRFTNLRITVQSGLLGGDRRDFTYDVVKDVKLVPRFIGEWGDMAIELKDGTKVDVRCVPKFREIAKYIEERTATGGPKKGTGSSVLSSSSSGRGGTSKKGFS